MPDISKEPVISVSDIPYKHTRGFCKYSRRCLPPQGSMLHSSAPKAVPRSRELPALLYVLTSVYSSDASRSLSGVICISPGLRLPPSPPRGGGSVGASCKILRVSGWTQGSGAAGRRAGASPAVAARRRGISERCSLIHARTWSCLCKRHRSKTFADYC